MENIISQLELIINKIYNLENKIDNLENKFNNKLDNKLDKLDNKLDKNVITECKKMGSHINFIENIYDNIKHPIGYIMYKIKNYIPKNTNYTLLNN